MIVVYFNPYKPRFKQYGFHVYRVGFLLEVENSREDFPTREAARTQAERFNSTIPFPFTPHEIMG